MKLLPLFLFFVACSSIPEPDPITPSPSTSDPRLRAALKFKADNVSYQGSALLPRRPGVGTDFQIELPPDARMIFVNSCAREEVFELQGGKTFNYSFRAGMFKENIGSCTLLFTVITKTGEYHRGVADFTNSNGRDLEAEVFCNGVWFTRSAADICQVKNELPVSVQFKEPVIFSHRQECAVPKCVSQCRVVNGVQLGSEFDIKVNSGFCGYDFLSKEKKLFRFTTLGYTSILNLFPPLK